MRGQSTLRVGAVLLIGGNLLTIISNSVQPAISDYSDTAEVFAAITATPLWQLSRIGILFAGVLGAGGVLIFAFSLWGERGDIPALLAAASSLVGVAVLSVVMGLDLAQREMADLSSTVQPEHSAAAFWAGQALHRATFAIFTIALIIVAGVTPMLLGLALLFGVGYPRWLGWILLASGIGMLACGIFQAIAGPTPLLMGVLIPLFGLLAAISGLVIGTLMWRKAISEPVT